LTCIVTSSSSAKRIALPLSTTSPFTLISGMTLMRYDWQFWVFRHGSILAYDCLVGALFVACRGVLSSLEAWW